MNLCSDGHEEICYDGRSCPLCRERDGLQAEIHRLSDNCTDLESQVIQLSNENEELSTRLNDELFEIKEMYKMAHDKDKTV